MTTTASAARVRSQDDLIAAARALGSSGGGAGAAHLLSLLYDPEVESERVLACLRTEPALSGRVLKVANSAYYRLSGSVGTVDRAVQILGLTAVRGIAASGCLDRMAAPRVGTAFDPDRFRQHSLAVACAAQQLARAAGIDFEGEAFMAGLLHDIGILLMVKTDAEAMARFEPPDSDDAAVHTAAERFHFGTTHEQCAGVLVQVWQLPDWLHEALCGHHGALPGPVGATGLDLLPGLLRLADRCAHDAGFALWPICGCPTPTGLAAAVGLTDEAVKAVTDELGTLVARLSPASGVRS